jgi:hypothetical protein
MAFLDILSLYLGAADSLPEECPLPSTAVPEKKHLLFHQVNMVLDSRGSHLQLRLLGPSLRVYC